MDGRHIFYCNTFANDLSLCSGILTPNPRIYKDKHLEPARENKHEDTGNDHAVTLLHCYCTSTFRQRATWLRGEVHGFYHAAELKGAICNSDHPLRLRNKIANELETLVCLRPKKNPAPSEETTDALCENSSSARSSPEFWARKGYESLSKQKVLTKKMTTE